MDIVIYRLLHKELSETVPKLFYYNNCWFCRLLNGNLTSPWGYGYTPKEAYEVWKVKVEREIRLMAGGRA